jgi:hypothetical protein
MALARNKEVTVAVVLRCGVFLWFLRSRVARSSDRYFTENEDRKLRKT